MHWWIGGWVDGWMGDTGCWMLDDGGGGGRGGLMGQSQIANSRERSGAGTERTLEMWDRKARRQTPRRDRARSRHLGGLEAGCRSGCAERVLSPFPLSSAAEERGIEFSGWLPRVADA